MKKIIIVDDTNENLEAAKQAALQFPEHEFMFTTSANEAFKMLPSADAIVTDLFFKEIATGELASEYESYIEQVVPEKLLPYEMIADYSKRMDASLEVLKTGIPENAIKNVNLGRGYEEQVSKMISELKPEFPFGGAIMRSAKRQGKKLCLVSNVHRHASNHSNSTSSSAGVVLLAPLLEDILTADQLLYDGEGSLTYMGGDEIYKHDKEIEEGKWQRTGKTDVNVWVEAIRRLLAQ